jgi:type II secretory pathway component GspD/PulD (secretin)
LSVGDSLLGQASCAQSDLVRDAATDCLVATYTIPVSDAGTTVTNTAQATGEHAGGILVAALSANSQLRVLATPKPPSTLATEGTNARLALIVVATLVAFGGLFVIAGRRSRRAR